MTGVQIAHSAPMKSFTEWQIAYREHIRCLVDWEGVGRLDPAPLVRTAFIAAEDLVNPSGVPAVYLPVHGPKVRERWFAERRRDLLVLRAPGIDCIVFNGVLILDGTHRIRELKPNYLIVDVLELDKRSRPFFMDAQQRAGDLRPLEEGPFCHICDHNEGHHFHHRRDSRFTHRFEEQGGAS